MPWLRGKPVVTGMDRGIASAMSKEAKALGISRGMRISDMKRICPEIIILSSDYDMYTIYARRTYNIVRRYTEKVEEYSIDECFADLTGCEQKLKISYEEIARKIQKDLYDYLDITFSVGLSVNKIMAKIASKWNKPNGLTTIPRSNIFEYISKLPIGKVWGIGPSSTLMLKKLGIVTAGDFATKDRMWVSEHCDKSLRHIYEELNGNYLMSLEESIDADDQKSIQKTGTFRPPSRDRNFVFSELSQNVENACIKLRAHGMLATHVSFFIKTQEFNYISADFSLSEAISTPQEIIAHIVPHFNKLFRPELLYRATGVTLSGLRPKDKITPGLFGPDVVAEKSKSIYETIDRLEHRFGRHNIFLGSSFKAMKSEKGSEKYVRAEVRKFSLPILGEVW
jgi:DNA polymerase-4/DNA polymerase V